MVELKNMCTYIIQSQEEEIKRIASELHEGVGQTLYSLYTQLQFLEQGQNNEGTYREMASIIEKTIQEVRYLAVELHPPSLSLGLVPAIKSYAKVFTSTYGIEVEVETTGYEQKLKESDSITLFRACQEALANIAKYADTSNAKVNIYWEEGKISLEILDDGKGFEVETALKQCSGLAATRERIMLSGGNFTIYSTVNEGTLIKIDLDIV